MVAYYELWLHYISPNTVAFSCVNVVWNIVGYTIMVTCISG